MTTPVSNMPEQPFNLGPLPRLASFSSGPRLGRKKAADPRDRGYLAADRVAGISYKGFASGLPSEYRYHKRGAQLDQGNTSRCTVFAMAQLIQSGPIMQNLLRILEHGDAAPTLDELLTVAYNTAQENDEWPGAEPTYYGTSGRAAAKVFQSWGVFGNYYWLTTVEEIARYIILYGPVPVGTDWFEGMDQPDHGNYLRPTGKWRGGHEYLLDGVSITKQEFRMRQSWGSGSDTYQSALVKFDDMKYLLAQGGDALALPEIRLPAKKKTISLGQPQWRKF